MTTIKRLAPEQIQKIAAGEIIERPVNIVKELVENALDAQATTITIYIEDGGKQLIRVVDNGIGMSKTDALLCFEHHTTSKLTSVDDLETIYTFGFRGEALSSIASVSNTTLLTKHQQDTIGTKLHMEGGSYGKPEPISTIVGTDIQVKDLFATVPARRKFLKTKDTEWRQIVSLIHAFALSNLSVHFKVVSDNSQAIQCPPASNLMERITQLQQHQLAQHLLMIDSKDKQIHLTGYISDPHFYKYDRSSIYYFINGRWIKNQTLSRALLRGYRNVLPDGRFPAAALFISIDPNQIDINTHPKKEEVMFLHPRQVEAFITKTVHTALENNITDYLQQHSAALPHVKYGITLPPNPLKESRMLSIHPYASFQSNFTPSTTPPTLVQKDHHAQQTISDQTIKQETFDRNYRLLSQYKKTYVLIEKEEGLLMVDQHAAQERVLYELFSQNFKALPTIPLLFPHTVTLSTEYIILIERHLRLFKDNGIGLEIFGKENVIVHSAPVHLKHVLWNELLHDILVTLQEHSTDTDNQKDVHTLLNNKLQAQMACKAAVKAGDSLTIDQMYQLIDDLEQSANRFNCPHGRPTCWLITIHDIEKKFKRKK